MSYPRPFTTFPGIVQRSPNFIDLQVRDRPEVNATRLWGSENVTDAYGTLATSGLAGSGGTLFAEAERGTSFVSRTWARTPLPEESRRGMMRYYFNPDDFVVPVVPPASLMPSDDAILFVRLQESHFAFGGWLQVPASAALNKNLPILGPILAIPNPTFWAQRRPALSFGGVAPRNTGCVVGENPLIDEAVQIPPPLILELPRPAYLITISNTSAAGTDLLVSAGLGVPMGIVNGTTSVNFEGGIRQIVLSGVAAATCNFSIFAVIDLEG